MQPEFFLAVFLVPAALSLLLIRVVGAAAGRVPERSEIDPRHKWDLGDLYPDQPAWEADFVEVDADVNRLAAMQGTLGRSHDALLEVLELRDNVGVKLERLYAYAALLKDQDTRQAKPQALFDRAGSLAVRYSESVSWLQPELLALPDKTLQEWCRANPKLAVYAHAFDDMLRQRKHVLTAREEELLAMSGKLAAASHQAFTMLTNADMKFPTIRDPDGYDVELSEARYAAYLQSPDRAFRQRAFFGTMRTYLSYKNTIATTLAGSVHKDVFYARAHNYDSALQAALSPDNVPVAVFDSLVATIREHLPTLHRYMDIRRQTLGLDGVHLYDTFVPLAGREPPKIRYDDAVATIIDGLAPLGREYRGPMKEGFAGRWIDVCEAQGKRSGAYSMGTYSVHPYILLNYTDTYREMFTVAHEMGHSMHTWFTQHQQPVVYGEYPIFLAEVASTTNEIILGHHLRRKAAGRTEKLFLVHLELEKIRGTVTSQVMWSEFEKLIHAQAERGGALTYETMSNLYRDLMQDYFGPAYVHDDEVDGYWLRIPHFYRGFYVYKYATSYCAAAALANRILAKERGAREDYLGFLKAGSSEYPIETLKRAGVDLSTPKPIADTMEMFNRLLDELEVLLQG